MYSESIRSLSQRKYCLVQSTEAAKMNIGENDKTNDFGDVDPSFSSSSAPAAAVIQPVINSSASNGSRGGGAFNKVLCRYFASNICYRGDSCSFSHDRNAKADSVCKYYLAGNCSYGQTCRYDHVRPKTQVSTSRPGPSASPAPTVSVSISPSCNPDVRVTNPSQQVHHSQKAPSRFSNLPSVETLSYCGNPDESQQKSGKAVHVVSCSSSKNFISPPPATENAWNRPLQSSNAFCMTAMSSELGNMDSNSYTPPGSNQDEALYPQIPLEDIPLCPYHETGFCIDGQACIFVHGNLCEMCGLNVLHPFNDTKCKEHHRECLAEHEKAMEEAFAEARSVDKRCGICMEMIVEKKLRFGILQNCKHCFCLNCIREWRRRSETFETKTVRSCPVCRVLSDFIIPSESWVEEQPEKDKVISLYRENMKQKQCKYVKAGQVDDCPFGNKCFYKHQLPDGTLARGESPKTLRRQRRYVLDLHRELLEDSDDEIIMTDVIHSLMVSMGGSSSDNNGRSARTNYRNSNVSRFQS